MQPAGQGGPRAGAWRDRFRVAGVPLVLAGLCACSADLSPERPLVSTRIEISDSAPQEIHVDAPTDLPILIRIRGRAVDVRARIVTGEAGAAAFADAPNRRMGVETLLVEAPHQPAIRVAIERNDHSGARGHVDLEAVALPIATESDRERVRAATLEAAGCLDFPDFSKGDQSAEAFRSAAELHDENGDRLRAGFARLHAAGARYARLADWPGAARLAAEAATALERGGASEYAAIALRLEGAALDQHANAASVGSAAREREVRLARDRLTAAAERFQAVGNAYEAGYALNYRGVSFDVAGERERAREDYQSALALFRRAGDPPAQALSLQSLALQSFEDGRVGDSMREFDEALALIPRDEDPENYAHTLHNSALPLRVIGRFDEAMGRFHEAGTILHERGDRDGEARALHGLGTTLMYAGEPERAAEFLEAAIRLRGDTGSGREQAVSLFVLGQIERETGKFEPSTVHLEKALSLVTAPHDLAQARLWLARTYAAEGRSGEARRELDEILRLPLPATHRYRGLALVERGDLESAAGQAASSREYFARGLEILKSNGSDVEYARTLVRWAEAKSRAAEYDSAIADTRAAISMFDAIGLQSLQAESRAAFRASYRDATEVQIGSLLARAERLRRRGETGPAREAERSALAASDRARGRLLSEASPRRQTPVAEHLERSRDAAYERLAVKRQQRERLQVAAEPDEDSIGRLTQEIALLRTEAVLLEGRIAKAQGVTESVASAGIDGDPTSMVPEGLVVAEYFIGRRQSWLFEIRRGQVQIHALGTGDRLARLARELHLAWRSPQRTPGGRPDVSRSLAVALFGPLGDPARDESLFVIPDGPLHLVPMAVLAGQVLPASRPGSIQIAVSLGALAERPPDTEAVADRRLAVIADPIYAMDDSRIAGIAHSAIAGDLASTRSALSPAPMQRLPSADVEARMIVSLAGADEALVLAGADASRQRLSAAGLDRFRIIHFATHAIADSQDPALALLALSRYDREGNRVDGDLRALDIARLRLNADVVVLSACETAMGREVAGEAPLGLSQAFLRSGARSVVATLWRVPDTSTALLMQEFYRQMLVNARQPAAALALAQQRIREQARWTDPYYWAGFQLTSNRRIDTGNNDSVERRRGAT